MSEVVTSMASDFSETHRVASTDPLEVTYQKSALNSKELAGEPLGNPWDGLGNSINSPRSSQTEMLTLVFVV